MYIVIASQNSKQTFFKSEGKQSSSFYYEILGNESLKKTRRKVSRKEEKVSRKSEGRQEIFREKNGHPGICFLELLKSRRRFSMFGSCFCHFNIFSAEGSG